MKKFDLEIIFEDADLLVVNKPYGVVVNRSDSYKGRTVQDWMEERLEAYVQEGGDWQPLVPDDYDEQYGSPEIVFQERLGMVHRLDKDTSGALVLAKNPGSLANLLSQFKKRTVQKQYLSLCHSKFIRPYGIVDLPIGRRHDDRKLFGVVPDGRPAETEYKVVDFFPRFKEELLPAEVRKGKRFSLYQGFTLVECRPKTGRTHQIRVHMKYLHHPIVGDSQYVGKKRAKLDELWCGRQFLHASQISLNQPRTGESLTLSADLTNDLKQVLNFVGEAT